MALPLKVKIKIMEFWFENKTAVSVRRKLLTNIYWNNKELPSVSSTRRATENFVKRGLDFVSLGKALNLAPLTRISCEWAHVRIQADAMYASQDVQKVLECKDLIGGYMMYKSVNLHLCRDTSLKTHFYILSFIFKLGVSKESQQSGWKKSVRIVVSIGRVSGSGSRICLLSTPSNLDHDRSDGLSAHIIDENSSEKRSAHGIIILPN